MHKNSIWYKLISLFLVFMKIGVLTFGGGYAMIPIIEEEASKKHKWITEMEILDIITVSESTPGPVSVNAATYIGFKIAGIPGAIISTLGLALPSFIIIFIISFFYKDFMKIQAINAMFKGLKVGVIVILLSAVLRLKKKMKTTLYGVIAFVLSLIIMLFFTFYNVNFDYLTLVLILVGLLSGIVLTALGKGEKE